MKNDLPTVIDSRKVGDPLHVVSAPEMMSSLRASLGHTTEDLLRGGKKTQSRLEAKKRMNRKEQLLESKQEIRGRTLTTLVRVRFDLLFPKHLLKAGLKDTT